MKAWATSELLLGTLRAGRSLLRAPVLAVLMPLEPLVRWLCSVLLVLGLLVSVVSELSAVGPRFPLLAVAGASLAFGLVLLAYYGLIALLAPSV